MHVDNAQLDWLDNGLPRSRQFDDVYFSRADARGESRHVFIQANELNRRWQQAESRQTVYVIAELGFGCGLNFLQTWQYWRECSNAGRRLRLHYIALEKYPPHRRDMARALAQWPELALLANPFLAQYPDHGAGCHRLVFDDLLLDLWYGDAETSLAAAAQTGWLKVDTWFADGFSPRANPDMWSAALFRHLACCSAPGATLSTYSVARLVRDGLGGAGFSVHRLPGFGSKREMLHATLTHLPESAPQPDGRPWFILPPPRPGPVHALVIGAGLAGASQALCLARRGLEVTVLEAADEAGAGASGNPQLALRCRLFARASPLAAFYLHGFLYTRRLLEALRGEEQGFWFPAGLVQLAGAVNKRQPPNPGTLARHYSPAVAVPATSAQLSRQAGLPLTQDGIYFPGGGWADGGALCRALMAHPRIRWRGGCPVAGLRRHKGGWRALDGHRQVLAEADVVVIANGNGANGFVQTRDLPLEVVRGQTTTIQASDRSAALAAVVCGQRTVFPAHEGTHTLAASYIRHDGSLDARPGEDASNCKLVAGAIAAGHWHPGKPSGSRVAVRANTPDRTPLLGPVPDLPAMVERYGGLARDASGIFSTPGVYLPGLYINAAHGSNGLSTAPLASEMVASLIVGEQPPADKAVLDLLNPVRFLIRDLKKQRLD